MIAVGAAWQIHQIQTRRTAEIRPIPPPSVPPLAGPDTRPIFGPAWPPHIDVKAASVAAPAPAGALSKGPLIVFENETLDLGIVRQESATTAVFHFTNRGAEVLRVSEVKRSCGCTEAILNKNEIPPGDSGEIKATFRAGDMPEKRQVSLTVFSNDASGRRTLPLTLKAAVEAPLRVNPGYLVYLGEVPANTTTEKTLTLSLPGGEAFALQSAAMDQPEFQIDGLTLNVPATSHTVKIRAKAPQFSRWIYGFLTLASDHDHGPPTRVKFVMHVSAQGAAKASSLIFDTISQDLGVVRPDSETSRVFRFVNRGNGTLQIGEIKTSCGCTATVLSSREVVPGVQGELKVTYKAGLFPDKKRETITVFSNDPERPQIVLSIMADVQPLLNVQPRFVNFGQVPRGNAVERMLALSLADGQPFSIKSAAINLPDFQLDVFKPGVSAVTHTLTVRAKAELPARQVDAILSIETDRDGTAPPTQTRVTMQVIGKIRADPSGLIFNTSARGQDLKKTVIVENATGAAFKILSAKIGKDCFSVDPVAVQSSSRYQMTVTFRAPTDDTHPEYQSELLIETDFAEEPLIRVPVAGRIF